MPWLCHGHATVMHGELLVIPWPNRAHAMIMVYHGESVVTHDHGRAMVMHGAYMVKHGHAWSYHGHALVHRW